MEEIEGLPYWQNESVKYDIDTVPMHYYKLRNYQKETVQACLDNEGVMIADGMGTGKTICSIAASLILSKRTIVICKGSGKQKWYKTILKAVGKDKTAVVLEGTTTHKLPLVDYYVLNWDILASWVTELIKVKADMVIFDEVHAAKSITTKRTKAAIKLATATKRSPPSGSPRSSIC
jgi:superfamily II DNA or RNA helicase